MFKTSHSVMGNPSVEGVTRQPSLDLNEPPDEVEIVDLHEKPKDDVPPLPHFYVDLRFRKEDMKVLKQKPKVLGSSSVACSNYFENLGFCNGNTTFICTRNKRVHFSGKSLYNLGRSWFKEGTIENDKDDEEEEPAGDIVGDAFKEVLEEIPVEQQDVDCMKSLPEPMCEEVSKDGGNGKEKQQDVDCMKTLPEPMCEVSKEGDMEKEKRDDNDADCLTIKEVLRDFGEEAKVQTRNDRKKGKMVQKQQQDVDCMKTLPEPMCEVSKEGDMEKEKRDDNDADRLTIKEVLRDFGEEAKVQTRNDRKKGKMVQKQVRATSAPSRRKRKAPKMRSLKDIYNDDKSQMLEQLV